MWVAENDLDNRISAGHAAFLNSSSYTRFGYSSWVDGSRTYYAEALAARRWTELYCCAKADFAEVGLRSSLWWLLRFGFFPLLPDATRRVLRRLFTGGRIRGVDRDGWLTPRFRKIIRQRRERHRSLPAGEVRRVGQRGQALVLFGAYSELARESEERLSSSAGLELRRPFFHPQMVQYSVSTPERLRLRGRIHKAMHKQAMAGLLPELVLTRETSADFTIAFRQHMPDLKDALTVNIAARRRDWVETARVAALYAQHGDRKHSGWPEWMLWTLFGCDALCLRNEKG